MQVQHVPTSESQIIIVNLDHELVVHVFAHSFEHPILDEPKTSKIGRRNDGQNQGL